MRALWKRAWSRLVQVNWALFWDSMPAEALAGVIVAILLSLFGDAALDQGRLIPAFLGVGAVGMVLVVAQWFRDYHRDPALARHRSWIMGTAFFLATAIAVVLIYTGVSGLRKPNAALSQTPLVQQYIKRAKAAKAAAIKNEIRFFGGLMWVDRFPNGYAVGEDFLGTIDVSKHPRAHAFLTAKLLLPPGQIDAPMTVADDPVSESDGGQFAWYLVAHRPGFVHFALAVQEHATDTSGRPTGEVRTFKYYKIIYFYFQTLGR